MFKSLEYIVYNVFLSLILIICCFDCTYHLINCCQFLIHFSTFQNSSIEYLIV